MPASLSPASPAVRTSAPRQRPRLRWRTVRVALALIALAAILLAALFAPWVAPYEPNAIDLGAAATPPSLAHPFGTDPLGRDVLSRTIFGARLSLFVTFCAVFIAGSAGTLVGLLAAYRGGWFDNVTSRLIEIQYALPPLILAMVGIGILGPGTVNLIVVVTVANWARFARIIRAETLSLRHRDYVLLASLAGASPLRIAVQHLLPNVRDTFLVLLTLDIGLIVILEAALSFLGLGVQPPDASWGTLISDGRAHLEAAWWMTILPGFVLMTTVLAANAIGDYLRERGSLRKEYD